MAKVSGGTRNYDGTSTYNKRLEEYSSYIENSEWDASRSMIDKSGGFVVTHKYHNEAIHENGDKSDIASILLAKKGYKVYLDDERSFISYEPTKDGRIYKSPMDVKTISKTGKNTIKSAVESAAKQGAKTAILFQNTESMTRGYVESQLNLFKEKSPQKCKEAIEWVIVVGYNGNVHRHKMK